MADNVLTVASDDDVNVAGGAAGGKKSPRRKNPAQPEKERQNK
jgi:hypothetical protein